MTHFCALSLELDEIKSHTWDSKLSAKSDHESLPSGEPEGIVSGSVVEAAWCIQSQQRDGSSGPISQPGGAGGDRTTAPEGYPRTP